MPSDCGDRLVASFIQLCAYVYQKIREGAEAYECGSDFVDPAIPPPVDPSELCPVVFLSTPLSADMCCVMPHHALDRDLGAESYLTPDLSTLIPGVGMHPQFAHMQQAGGMDPAWEPAQDLAAAASDAAYAFGGPGQAHSLEFQPFEEDLRSLCVVYAALLC
jgi:hypothetical protein